MNDAETIGYVLLALLVVGSLIASMNQNSKLESPENTDVVYPDQLLELCVLPEEGDFILRTYRQSGNLQKDDLAFNSSEAAVKSAISTFKRAKIECVTISNNSLDLFAVGRTFHGHRGVAEGKKVGSIEIHRV